MHHNIEQLTKAIPYLDNNQLIKHTFHFICDLHASYSHLTSGPVLQVIFRNNHRTI